MRIPKSKALYVSAAVLALLGSGASVARAAYKTVTVQDNGQRRTIRGFTFGSLGAFLKSENVEIPSRSRVLPSLSAQVTDGMKVVIVQPYHVQLNDGGTVTPIETYQKTVGDLIREQGVILGKKDTVSEPFGSKLYDGEVIKIRRMTSMVSTKTQEIPFQTLRRSTDTLYAGQTRLLTHGVKGLLEIQTTSVFVDGRRVGQSEIKHVKRAAVNEVLEVGVAPRPIVLSSRSSGPISVLRSLTVVATAYVGGGRTATGWYARPGVISVDPSVIPLGTKLYIPGIGVAYAEDTGLAIKGSRIDICMSTQSAADVWGMRTITVYVVH